MSTILEMAADIVAAHASTTTMSKKELVEELTDVYQALEKLEKGMTAITGENVEKAEDAPMVTRKKAFGKDKIYCMLCGKGMKTLARHLRTTHDMTPRDYRQQFDIPRTQPLAARAYSETRRQMAIDRGLGEKLAKARASRKKPK